MICNQKSRFKLEQMLSDRHRNYTGDEGEMDGIKKKEGATSSINSELLLFFLFQDETEDQQNKQQNTLT